MQTFFRKVNLKERYSAGQPHPTLPSLKIYVFLLFNLGRVEASFNKSSEEEKEEFVQERFDLVACNQRKSRR